MQLIQYFKILLFSLVIITFFKCNSGDQAKSEDALKNTAQSKTSDKSKNNRADFKNIVFFGDSITAGYGLEKENAFPALIQKKLDSLNLKYRTVNAGLSGETSAGGLRRVDWILKQKIDIFVLELGGNDGLRGIPTPETYKNLKGIIEKVNAKYPDCKIVLAGMEAPPNMGKTFTDQFRQNYTKLSKEYQLPLIPFVLEKVAGRKDLNLPDGIHPTAEGHKLVMQTIWETLSKVI